MESKVMRIFYGADALPYKDKARTVHYPIIGQAFEGASGTTEIHFYVDQIGGTDTTKWVSYAKLPSGKKGYKMLDSYEDTELNENYVKLTLSQFYTQEKGDVYISLNGFDGGVELEQDSDDNYVITGTPVIQATGSVKITMQYSVQLLPSDIQEYIELDDILAYISGKADVNYVDNNFLRKLEINPQDQDYIEPIGDLLEIGHDPIIYGIKVESEGNYLLSIRPYQSQGQWTAELAFYDLYSHSFVSYEEADLDNISLNSLVNDIQGYGLTFATLADVNSKVSKTDSANKVYATNGSGTQANLDYGTGTTGNAIVQRDANGQVNVPDTPSDNNDATSKGYVLGQVQAKQDLLVSGTNIKTINNESILGSGNIDIQGGGGNAEWGSIAGNIADQTDLQNEFQNVREVAEGKCETFVLSYAQTTPTSFVRYYDFEGNEIGTGSSQAVLDYISTRPNENANFNSNSASIQFNVSSMGQIIQGYLIVNRNDKSTIALIPEDTDNLKQGDIFLVIQTDVPDRWAFNGRTFYKMETSKVDLSSYVDLTSTQTISGNKTFSNGVKFNNTWNFANAGDWATAVYYGATPIFQFGTDHNTTNKHLWPSANNTQNLGSATYSYKDIYFGGELNPNSSGYGYTLPSTASFTSDKTIASVEDLSGFNAYSSSQTYAVGDKVVYGGKLYRCSTAITTAESWDSTHWTEITLSDYVDTFSDQTISGNKTFNGTVEITNSTRAQNIRPRATNSYDLGSNSNKWKDIYLSGNITDGTNSVSVAQLSGVCGSYSTNSTTQLEYSYINNISISADTTFTLATAPANTYPEYKANITNTDTSNAITITLPSGTIIKGNVSISSNTFEIPADSSVELNIQNQKALVMNWGA